MHEYLLQFGTCLYAAFENFVCSRKRLSTVAKIPDQFIRAESVHKQDCSVNYIYRLSQKSWKLVTWWDGTVIHFSAFWQPSPPSSSMPFLYDVCNVKLQWYANGFAWWKGGTHLKKTFSISYMFNSINQVFFPYLLTSTCQTRKSLWGIIWGLDHLSFHGKKYHFIYIFILAFSIGNLSIKVSELL